ncbi:MAG: DEAD/DEAH box helicase [Zoogloeaceae bacterium]|nr:DEAD/DEAH box helicase [Zoogloeaceae bacterium]
MHLRDYQRRTIDTLWQWFRANPEGNPIIEASVGAGKSVMIAALAREALTQWPGTRILMVVASRELCAQNLEKLMHVWPQAPAGVHSAGLGRKDLNRDILYATIGSVAKKAHLLGRVDLLLVDECQNVSPKNAGMYRQLIGELSRYNPQMRVIGWTGTAFRGDGIWLTAAEEPIFTHVAARVTMRELLDASFLAPLVSGGATQRLEAEGVRMSGGDFVVSALAEKVDRDELVQSCADELVALAADRRRWLVYGVTVEHARHIAEALTQRGIACAVLSAETPNGKRDAHIKAFRAGRLRALVNVAVLTTGFDVPEVDCIALLRNTRSPVLYVQIAGRGMRIADGKRDCLWLDFTDTTATLGPVDAIKGRTRTARKSGEAVAPVKHCDTCGNPAPGGAAACEACGALFPEPERINHSAQVSSANPLSAPVESAIEALDVSDVRYRKWSKPGSPDSLLVEYWGGVTRIAREWVCIEHAGFARQRAITWWHRRAAAAQVPNTVAEALQSAEALQKPARITINNAGKYPEIISYQF